MKTLAKPLNLIQINLLGINRGWLARPAKLEKTMNSIFGLACQRCAGYTTGSTIQKDY